MKRRMTYCWPEKLEPVPGSEEEGRRVMQRPAGAPTREARSYELNVWWEDTGEEEVKQ